MKINLSSMNKSHIDDILEISNLSFHTPWSKESISSELNNKIARYLVASDEYGKVVGYGGVWVILGEGDITNIAVHPEYRGNNIGSLILDEMIKVCAIENVSAMTLEVRKSNIIAQKLYKKFGFIEEGIRKGYYQDNGEDAIIMWKHNMNLLTYN